MTDRAFQIHYARVLLADCAVRRHWPASRDFYWTQFAAAQNARRKAMGMTDKMAFPQRAIRAYLTQR